MVAHDVINHRLDFALRQPIEGESSDVGPPDPVRFELWTKRHNQQHTVGPKPVNDPAESFLTRGIGPMCILENHQHRLLAR